MPMQARSVGIISRIDVKDPKGYIPAFVKHFPTRSSYTLTR